MKNVLQSFLLVGTLVSFSETSWGMYRPGDQDLTGRTRISATLSWVNSAVDEAMRAPGDSAALTLKAAPQPTAAPLPILTADVRQANLSDAGPAIP